MKRDRFFISVLWIIAVALMSSWFFDVMWSFNIFARAHWRYLSELQVSGAVDRWFYISLAAFAALGLVVLLILTAPWGERNDAAATGIALDRQEKKSPVAPVVAGPGALVRPAGLDRGSVFIPPVKQGFEMPAIGNLPAAPAASGKISAINGMLESAGFFARSAPKVGGLRLDFWSIGPGEILVAGLFVDEPGDITAFEGGASSWRANGHAFESPVWKLTGAVQKLTTLFGELIGEDLKIEVLPFVFVSGKITNKDSVQSIWDALKIEVFDDMDALERFIDRHRAPQLTEEERGEFEAFDTFINTVAEHFNNNV